MGAPAGGTPSGEEIDAILRGILERDEFKSLQDDHLPATELIGELLESAMRAIQALVGDLRANHPGVFVAILVVGTVIIGASIWFGARGAARRRGGDAQLRPQLPEVLRGDPAQLRADAERAAREGRFLDAVRWLFRATIIDRALREGTLEKLRDAEAFRRARTYRELVDEFARDPAQAARMSSLASRIEHGLYAGHSLGAEDWNDARVFAEEMR